MPIPEMSICCRAEPAGLQGPRGAAWKIMERETRKEKGGAISSFLLLD